VQSYSKRYGASALQTFQSGFGNFSSPQNAFLSEQVAMELQGVWMHNFIDKYAPNLEWGAAPFPHPAFPIPVFRSPFPALSAPISRCLPSRSEGH
jgi:ABC-type glycerol-3-phosphate transport system substrate-binding protein